MNLNSYLHLGILIFALLSFDLYSFFLISLASSCNSQPFSLTVDSSSNLYSSIDSNITIGIFITEPNFSFQNKNIQLNTTQDYNINNNRLY